MVNAARSSRYASFSVLWLGGAVAACSQISRLDSFTFVAPCVPEAAEETCKAVECGVKTNNCQVEVTCPDTCSGADVCGDDPARPNFCDCIPGSSTTKCCVPEPKAETCKEFVCGGPTKNNCGSPVTCPNTCAAPKVCDGTQQCTCVSATQAEACVAVACGKVPDKCSEDGTVQIACPSTCEGLYECEVGGVAANTCGCTGGTMETPGVPDDFTAYEKVGHTYYVSNGKAETWSDARALCKSFHTDIVRPQTLEQNQVLQSILVATAWVGLQGSECDVGKPCTFSWIDKMPLSEKLAMAAWFAGEPNNFQNTEHCAAIYRADQAAGPQFWNDVACGGLFNVVCEATCPVP